MMIENNKRVGQPWERGLPARFDFRKDPQLAICTFLFFTLAFSLSIFLVPAQSAENLRLREGLSYTHDLDKGFPIIAEKMENVRIEPNKATLIFFGAAGDLNTNRQAKRIVELYKKYKEHPLKFIVMDVDHVSAPEAKQLLKSYYQGYIPQEVILDKEGKTFWTHIGEIDNSPLSSQLEKVLQ